MRCNIPLLGSIFLMSLVICFATSCTTTYWEMQEQFLLPEALKIKRQMSKEIGISTLNTYRVSGNLKVAELKNYPKYAMDGRGWEMVHWHKPTNQEIANVLALSEQEDITEEVKSVLETIKNNQSLIAYAHDTDDIPLSKDGYETHQWIELYFLIPENNQITHVSYGRF